MHTIENEFEACIDVIKQQTHQDFDYFVIENLPNKEAHDTLYQKFMDNADTYDLFVKIDADMVLCRTTFFEEVVKKMEDNPDIDDLQIAVHDFFTDTLIYGLHVYRNTVTWKTSKERIFVDRIEQINKRVNDKEELAPAAYHCPNPSLFQSFHYGLHKAVKVLQVGATIFDDFSSRFHLGNLKKIKEHYLKTNDLRLAFALIGADIALQKRYAHEEVNFDNGKVLLFWQSVQERPDVEVRKLADHITNQNHFLPNSWAYEWLLLKSHLNCSLYYYRRFYYFFLNRLKNKGLGVSNRIKSKIVGSCPTPAKNYIFYQKLVKSSRQGFPPICVYQMGKVGSTTVYQTLTKDKDVKNPVFHVHFFHKTNIERIKYKYRNSLSFPEHLNHTKKLLKYKKNGKTIYLVSMVREPIALMLSHIFHNPHIHRPFLVNENGEICVEATTKHIQSVLSESENNHSLTYKWFDDEFSKSVGINVTECDFNRKKGYGLTTYKNYRVLLLKLEALNTNYKDALSELLGFSVTDQPLYMNRNSATLSIEDFDYESFKSSLSISTQALRKIYSHPYIRFFYTEQETQHFIDKWS